MRIKKFVAALLLAVIIMSMSSFSVLAEHGVISVGASYTATADSPVSNAFPNLADKDNGKSLTDGIKGGDNPSDSAYVHFYRGTYYSVVIDLGTDMGVDGVVIGQLQIVGAGIHFSREIYLSVSSDGENFADVGSYVDDNIIRDGGDGRKDFEVKADATYKARYVRVKFSSDIFCYVDEISVLGYKDAPSDAKSPSATPKAENIGFKGAIDDINHICLIYSGEYYMGSKSNTGKVTQEQLTPYLCYVDPQGKVQDTMFEGMLFLPLAPISSSEGPTAAHSFGKKTGWEAYLDATMGKNDSQLYNLAALNAEVGEKRDELKLDNDYKYPVYIAVPYIEPSATNAFGEIDGKIVTPNSVEARQTIVDWYIDLVISKFNSAGFDNLQLNGFYWYSETILYKYGDSDIKLIKHFNEYAQGKGYSTTWIPYYCSPGYERAVELGFTGAVLQSGHAFKRADSSETGDSKPGTCDDAVAQADKYGLGIEIEVSSLEKDGFNRYYKYLQASYSTGHMADGLFMYYQNGGPGTYYHASKAEAGSLSRRAYDITYQFIKGTFSSKAPSVAEDQVLIVKKGTKVSGHIPVIDEDSESSDLSIVDLVKPEQIKVVLEGSGFIVINTKDSDFIGETEFTFKVSDGYNVSEPITVKINVVEDCFEINGKNREMRNNFAVVYDTGNTTGTNSDVYEVVVENGVITKVGGNNNEVPTNGYVIAASGDKKSYLEANAAKGKKVIYDTITNSMLFTDEAKSGESGSNLPLIIAGVAAIALAAAAIISVLKKLRKKN